MNKLFERHGYSTISRALRILEIGLNRVPELKAHSENIVRTRATLNEAHAAFTDKQEQRMAATTEIHYLDKRLDDMVITLGQSALLEYGRDRNNPAYKRLFPLAPSKMMHDTASMQQAQYITVLVETIMGEESYASFRERAQDISAWAEQLNQALNRRATLYIEEAKERANYLQVADMARRFYNTLYHQFMATLPGSESLIESLFPKLSKNPPHEEE